MATKSISPIYDTDKAALVASLKTLKPKPMRAPVATKAATKASPSPKVKS